MWDKRDIGDHDHDQELGEIILEGSRTQYCSSQLPIM